MEMMRHPCRRHLAGGRLRQTKRRLSVSIGMMIYERTILVGRLNATASDKQQLGDISGEDEFTRRTMGRVDRGGLGCKGVDGS
jgi:hypothetical protein